MIEIEVSNKAYKQKEILTKAGFDVLNNKVRIKNVYIKSKRVNDVMRYVLQFDNQHFQIVKEKLGDIGIFQDKQVHKLDIDKNIVLVIESPHKDEYEEGKPIAPAQGRTGINIYNKICQKLDRIASKKRFEKGTYGLIIANPVQFQASLYDFHGESLTKSPIKEIRNKVFKKIYEYEEKNFIDRINSYSPKIIINACTSGLKPIIGDSLEKYFSKEIIFKNSHPSLWK